MIKELRLKNWKSFDEATLYIDPLTILIGTNASGKSNTLDALLFLQRISSGMEIFQAIKGGLTTPALRGGMEWICLKPYTDFSLELIIDGANKKEEYRYFLNISIDNSTAIILKEELFIRSSDADKEESDESLIFSSVLPLGDELGVKFGGNVHEVMGEGDSKFFLFVTNRSLLTQVEDFYPATPEVLSSVKYVLKLLRGIFVFDPIPSHMRDYAPLSHKLIEDGSNLAGVLAALKEPRKTEVEESLTHYLKALPERDIERVWTETVGRSNSDAMLYCEEGWSENTIHEIDARGMSDGTLRYLAIVTALLTREEGSLLVIEEVDNGLHPSRAGALLEMLRTLGKERNIDVIVTTHNPALLDAAGIRMLPYIAVAYRDDKTGVSRLKQLEDLKQLPKLLASGNLGKLSTEGRIQSALKREDQV